MNKNPKFKEKKVKKASQKESQEKFDKAFDILFEEVIKVRNKSVRP